MAKHDPSEELAKVNAHIARNHKRWSLISNRLTKLYKKKKRLENRIAKAAPIPPVREVVAELEEISAGATKLATDLKTLDVSPLVDNGDNLDVRNQPWNQADLAAKAAIAAELAEHKQQKTKGRIARLKARQQGATRKMPLSGKAALDYINKD